MRRDNSLNWHWQNGPFAFDFTMMPDGHTSCLQLGRFSWAPVYLSQIDWRIFGKPCSYRDSGRSSRPQGLIELVALGCIFACSRGLRTWMAGSTFINYFIWKKHLWTKPGHMCVRLGWTYQEILQWTCDITPQTLWRWSASLWRTAYQAVMAPDTFSTSTGSLLTAAFLSYEAPG